MSSLILPNNKIAFSNQDAENSSRGIKPAGFFFPQFNKNWPTWNPTKSQRRLLNSRARFKVVPAGRRSGKTELAKLVLEMVSAGGCYHPGFGIYQVKHTKDPQYFCAAPTLTQARRIYWEDLKRLSEGLLAKPPRESEMILTFKTGAKIFVLGMDSPERIEGTPWDGGILDEYGNMKSKAWSAHVRPALSTLGRPGWCWLIGVPEGRNHYYRTYNQAIADDTGEWAGFTWKSSEVLPPEEIAAAMRDMDLLTFKQEYEADFVTFEGRAYYAFTDQNKSTKLTYDPLQPLAFCFDFNVSPGVAAVAQEQIMPGQTRIVENRYGEAYREPVVGTGVIGEVYIPRNSTTKAVCNKLIQDWGRHQGLVICYGDATGGSKGSAKNDGSDWEIIKQCFRNSPLADKMRYRVPTHNPQERVRLNAVNSRCLSVTNEIKLMAHPHFAKHVIEDFEGVTTLIGGSGEIDKKANAMLTHISDGLGYYIVEEFPINKRSDSIGDM